MDLDKEFKEFMIMKEIKEAQAELSKKFKIFLIDKEMTAAEFSSKIGKHRSYISRIMKGHIFPSYKLIEIIEKETGRKIRRSDFVKIRNKKTIPEKNQSVT